MIAMGIMTALLLAVQSTIVLAARAIPDSRSKATALITSSAALDALNADLTFATAIVSRGDRQITFQVADRNGDGSAETITWAWSGTSGASLTRTVNSGSAVAYATGVKAFSLAYDVRSTPAPASYTAGPEQLFAYNAGNPGGLVALINPNTDNRIRSDEWVGQYFKPTLPSNAVSWAVTRIQLKAQIRNSIDGQVAVQIRPVNTSGLPTTTVLDQAILSESSLGSNYAWKQFSYTAASGIPPTSGAAIVCKWVAGADACEFQGQSILLVDGNKLTSNGVTWTTSSQTLNYYVYGTVTTQDPVTTLYYLTGARATLSTSADSGATARATIRMINEIQVTGP
jgi:hypothetical protein